MILNTTEKKIELRFTTRKIIALTKELKNKNLSELYFKALAEEDIEKLVKVIQNFAEDENGNVAFKKFDEACEFIDKYMKEQNKTYTDLYNELGNAINEEGFFQKKYSEKELQDQKKNLLYNLDMNELIQSTVLEEMQKIIPTDIIT